MLAGEADDGLGRVVVWYLVPVGAQVGGQLPQPVDRPGVCGQGGVADGDVDHVQFCPDPRRDAGRTPERQWTNSPTPPSPLSGRRTAGTTSASCLPTASMSTPPSTSPTS